MRTVFDPGNLFVSESDWHDKEKKDIFLLHLLENLDHINEYKITKVYWTDELENLLWDSPQLPLRFSPLMARKIPTRSRDRRGGEVVGVIFS